MDADVKYVRRPSTRHKITCGIQVGSVINCADNTGAKTLKVISVRGVRGRLNRLQRGAPGDIMMCTVVKGKAEFRHKIFPVILVRQKKIIRRRNGDHVMFADNAGVLITPKGDIRGTKINGIVSKECSDLWPKIASLSRGVY